MKCPKQQIQTEWLDCWFKVPVIQVGNNDFEAKLKELTQQGIFVQSVTVKKGGYEIHGRKE